MIPQPNAYRTKHVVANLRRLLAQLAAGEMTRDAITKMLGLSSTATRIYTATLKADGIIKISRRISTHPGTIGQPVFALVADAAAIERFVDKVAENGWGRAKQGMAAVVLPVAPGRHFHVLDTTSEPLPITIPPHDPIHAAFWGGRAAA